MTGIVARGIWAIAWITSVWVFIAPSSWWHGLMPLSPLVWLMYPPAANVLTIGLVLSSSVLIDSALQLPIGTHAMLMGACWGLRLTLIRPANRWIGFCVAIASIGFSGYAYFGGFTPLLASPLSLLITLSTQFIGAVLAARLAHWMDSAQRYHRFT